MSQADGHELLVRADWKLSVAGMVCHMRLCEGTSAGAASSSAASSSGGSALGIWLSGMWVMPTMFTPLLRPFCRTARQGCHLLGLQR